MAPGDLNLKKSWNPALIKNQQKVWEKEQEALAERKKIQERQQEILKERELAELRALQYAKTGKKISDRVEWMYDTSGVGDGGKLMTDEAEEYLLGKKRVDDLILKRKDEEKSVKGFERVVQSSDGMISQKEEMRRNRDDPLARINEQRMKKMQETMLEKKIRDDKERRNGAHRSSSSHRRRDDDRSHRSRRRRDDERSEHHGSHDRHHRSNQSHREKRDREREIDSRDKAHSVSDQNYRERESSRRQGTT